MLDVNLADQTAAPTPSVPLTDRDREILAFERQWWKYAGSKEQAIKELFDMSSTRYYQVLNGLINNPAALSEDPMLIKRLRRLQDQDIQLQLKSDALSPAQERKYKKLKEEIIAEVKSLRLNQGRIDALVEQLYDINKRLVGYEGRLMRSLKSLLGSPLMQEKTAIFDGLAASVPFPKRLGHPHEFGSLVLELARNGYFNGQNLRLDGAIRMPPK